MKKVLVLIFFVIIITSLAFIIALDEPRVGGCGTVTPGYNDECCKKVGYDKWDSEKKGCVNIKYEKNKEKGTIKFVDVEGGCWKIVGNNQVDYEPLNLEDKYKKDGLYVEFEWREANDRSSNCMVGRLIELTEIKSETEDENSVKDTDKIKNNSCKNLYWFNSTTNECVQKEFCGLYIYNGSRTFKDKNKCEEALQLKERVKERNKLKIHSNVSECPDKCSCTGSVMKCTLEDGSREMTIIAGNSGSIIIQIKGINMSTNVTLYKNNETGKIEGIFKEKTKTIILPDEAFQKVQEELNARVEARKMELDENGNYQIETQKKSKLFGLISVKERVQIQLNAETGEIIRKKTSWWGFLAKDETLQ